MSRKKIIAGNWKMNMTPTEAVKLVELLKPLVVNDEVDVVFCKKWVESVAVEVEVCLNGTLCSPGLHGLGICPLSEKQSQGTQDDALSGSRFTGYHREAAVEADVKFLYEGEILDI